MSSKLNTLDAVIYGAGLLLFIGLMASVICSVLDNQTVANGVANGVANKVTNTVTDIVTETEVYKVVCTVDGEGYCKEYSVRRLNRE